MMNLNHIAVYPEREFHVDYAPEVGEMLTVKVISVDYHQQTVVFEEEQSETYECATKETTLENFRQRVKGYYPSNYKRPDRIRKDQDVVLLPEAHELLFTGQLNYFQAKVYWEQETPHAVLVWANHMPFMRVRTNIWNELANSVNAAQPQRILWYENVCLDLPILEALRTTNKGQRQF